MRRISRHQRIFGIIILACTQTASLSQTPQPTSGNEIEVAKSPEYLRAKELEESDELPSMLIEAKRVVERYPTSGLAHKLLSDAYYYLDFFDLSAAQALKAIEVNPQDPIAWRNLGLIRDTQDDLVQAELAYKQGAVVAPDNPVAWSNLAQFYATQGQIAFALHCADKASALIRGKPYVDTFDENPERWIWAELGSVYTECGRPSDGVSHLQKALSLDPKDSDYWVDLSKAYGQLGQRDLQLSAIQQAMKIEPDSEEIKSIYQQFVNAQQTLPTPQTQPQNSLSVKQMTEVINLLKKMQELQNLQNESDPINQLLQQKMRESFDRRAK